VKICLRTNYISKDPETRRAYCVQIGATAAQESAKSIPAAVERGYPTGAELREYRKPFDEAGIEIIGLEPVLEPVRAWADDTPDGHAAFDVFKRHLDAAGEAGIPAVTLHPPLDDAKSAEEAERQFDGNVYFYRKASAAARDAGTRLATHSPWPPEKGLWSARTFMSIFDAVPDIENGMIFCFGCMGITRSDIFDALPKMLPRINMVHVRDIVLHDGGVANEPHGHGLIVPTTPIDEVFPGTGFVRPDMIIGELHRLGYTGAIAPEHLPNVFGESWNEISMAWAIGYCHAALQQAGASS